MRALVIALAVLAGGCFVMSPVVRFGGGKSANESQHEQATKMTPPVLVAAGEGWSGEVAVAKIRVWADEDYRAQNVHWRQTFAEQLAYANEMLGPMLGVRLEAEYRDWPRRAPAGEPLEETLHALGKQDAGTDVAHVVGLTSALSLVSATFEKLGVATIGGRHLVLRGYADGYERLAFDQAFRELRKEERDALYQARRRHKSSALLLHELGHNLGAAHTTELDTIMNPIYSDHAATFDSHSREVMLATADQRLHRAKTVVATKAAESHPSLVVTLDDTSHAMIGGRVVDDGTLDDLLKMSFTDDPETEVVVRASTHTAHAAVVHVIDRAKAAGLHRVSLVAADSAPP